MPKDIAELFPEAEIIQIKLDPKVEKAVNAFIKRVQNVYRRSRENPSPYIYR
tara:strand:+ start:175 stop:330 length:156 start_codon:yes stop_codon:yes gene_type:complete